MSARERRERGRPGPPPLFAAALLVALCALPGPASAAGSSGELLVGEVVAARSRWARGGTSIITESTLRLDDGREVTVRQRGGSVDGVGMLVWHAPPVLRVGDRVMARVTAARDLRGRTARLVQELYAPPPPGAAATAGRMPFVRTVATRTRVPLYWESGCAIVHFAQGGTSHLPGDLEIEVMEESLDRWRQATGSCSYLDLVAAGRIEGEVGLDAVNLVVFREDQWCRPATEDEPEECYDPDAAGLTTLFFVDDEDSDRNGAILDADVELNGVHFAISSGGDSEASGGCLSDLSNTFTHEIGHLMGLDHTCFAGGERLVDDRGEPQPNCEPVDQLPDELREATMFNFQECGETSKATPGSDDIDGVCGIYPLADDPGECEPVSLKTAGCCAIAAPRGRSARGALPLLALALAALLVLRRR
ncbi:MAG TPA: hypothetical protein VKZ63_13525 [Kofleriaceae bacterium]|nr:hypothetical protein [Kofleriaceae bacterium]